MKTSSSGTVHADRDRGVVLLHSLGTDSRLWRHQTACLQSTYDVLTPNACGHGDTPWPGAVSVEAWTRDLRCVIGDRGPVHLIGLSMGGLQALAFSARYPDLVRSVTIANSFARLPLEVADARVNGITDTITQHGMTKYARSYLDQTLTKDLEASDYQALFSAIAGMDDKAYIESAAATFRADMIPLLASITSPALVITGALDTKVPSERTAELTRGIRRAAHEVIPHAGHLSCIENPEHFNAVITSFLDRVDTCTDRE